jgi:hypothetical protein
MPMIREQELLDAIAECQGQRNPNANTCIKLASFYTILDHITDKKEDNVPMELPMYSYDASPDTYTSDTEFGQRIVNMDINEVLTVMDELMTTLSVVNPRLYAAVLRKL